jgi:hypothetical protein
MARINHERNLWAAVLKQAVDDLFPYERHSKWRYHLNKSQLIKADAVWWFKKRGKKHIYSFESVCETLDIDPDRTRETIFKLADIY